MPVTERQPMTKSLRQILREENDRKVAQAGCSHPAARPAGIDTKGLRLLPFIERLALRLTGERRAAFVESENVWYLGAGYWRAYVTETGFVRLVNPSVKQTDIEIVEAAMNILS